MKAKLSVTEGAVRIFLEPRTRPDPTPAPYETELDGQWAVGSGSTIGNLVPTKFTLEALEDGQYRVFTQDTESYNDRVSKGEKRSYDVIESNAYTVSTGPTYEKLDPDNE